MLKGRLREREMSSLCVASPFTVLGSKEVGWLMLVIRLGTSSSGKIVLWEKNLISAKYCRQSCFFLFYLLMSYWFWSDLFWFNIYFSTGYSSYTANHHGLLNFRSHQFVLGKEDDNVETGKIFYWKHTSTAWKIENIEFSFPHRAERSINMERKVFFENMIYS